MNTKVLLVEDDPLTIEFMRIFLSGEGFTVFSTTTIKEARQVMSTERPQIVISDMGLPDGSGIDFVRQLKSEVPETKIFGVTGSDKTQLSERGLEDGILDEVFTKPLEFSQLLVALKK